MDDLDKKYSKNNILPLILVGGNVHLMINTAIYASFLMID